MAGNIVDILRVEGVMAQGYGMIPKTVVRDHRLTAEAKAIYAYLSSFAGGGNQAFPARNLMLAELGMSSNRYYRHFKKLVECDYIKVEQTKAAGNLFSKNIYVLVAQPDCKVQEDPMVIAKKGRSEIVQSRQSDQPVQKHRDHYSVSKRSSVQELRKRLEIDELKLQQPEQEIAIEEVFMAVEDLSASEKVTISGTTRGKEAIDAIVEKLTPDHIRLVADTLYKNNKKLINRKAYIQTCVINSIFDINNIPPMLKQITKTEEDNPSKEHDLREKKYKQYPELLKLDKEIAAINMEMSKVILQGNEVKWQQLKLSKEYMEKQRNEFTGSHGLTGF